MNARPGRAIHPSALLVLVGPRPFLRMRYRDALAEHVEMRRQDRPLQNGLKERIDREKLMLE
jgi:hypothetical protein